VLKSSTYYMNNRKAFKTKINSLLYPTGRTGSREGGTVVRKIGERGF
jgi:hypothetical protein